MGEPVDLEAAGREIADALGANEAYQLTAWAETYGVALLALAKAQRSAIEAALTMGPDEPDRMGTEWTADEQRRIRIHFRATLALSTPPPRAPEAK